MRFIQVGVGGFGNCWVNVLKNSPDAEVVGLVDLSDAALKSACEVGGYDASSCFSSLEEALATVQADAVVCATPPAIHEHDVVTALEAGLHAISEKPMSDNLDACKRMLAAAARTGKTYCVSQNYRYSPATWTMAQQIQAGDLGPVGQVKIDFFKGIDFGGGFRHDMPFPVIVDMAIHHFDLIRFITGLNAVQVQGSAWNPPWSNYAGDCSSTALFTMDNGARILYNASWCAKGDLCDWNANWQIECEKGTLVYSHGKLERLSVPELYKVEETTTVPLVDPPKGGQNYVLDDFIRSIEAGTRPKTDVVDNIRDRKSVV